MIDKDDASNFDHKHVPIIIILESEEIVDNDEEEEKKEQLELVEHLEQIEPLSIPNFSNDKEVSIEAHFFITIPIEILHEPKIPVLQYLKESSYDTLVKDLCTQARKSRNHIPK
jgi:hypothetical protein